MRLSTDENRSEQVAFETIAAAAQAGITIYDTAHAYGHGPTEFGHNERLLARALRQCAAADRARIVTKGGMTRVESAWVADGRSKSILADCEASLRALDGIPIDLYLIHAPDPHTPWATSVRALARLLDQGLVRHIGVGNVNRRQLEEALAHADISAVQVALNPFDDRALRGGIVDLCEQKGISLIAHSPLGGPRRVARLGRIQVLAEIAEAIGTTPAEIALAWLVDLSPAVVAIPGARRPETVRSAVHAASLSLSDADREALAGAIGGRRVHDAHMRAPAGAEVVMVMGVPGAGKTLVAEDFAGRGYVRLNRDERGGSLREIASTLDEKLSEGAQRLVLDNTYLTRASRNLVVETARRHGASVRCVWLDTPLEQAQINMVERLLNRFGSLPAPEELRRLARSEPGVHTPTTQMRTVRELEPPSIDEGFADVDRRAFVRRARSGRTEIGVIVAAEALARPGWQSVIEQFDPRAPHLIFEWCPEDCGEMMKRATGQLSRVVTGPIQVSICPHGGGPPICWCRPPLPGLPVAFAHTHHLDLSRSFFAGTTTAHRRLASMLGSRYLEV